jgi:hypothetical protein
MLRALCWASCAEQSLKVSLGQEECLLLEKEPTTEKEQEMEEQGQAIILLLLSHLRHLLGAT